MMKLMGWAAAMGVAVLAMVVWSAPEGAGAADDQTNRSRCSAPVSTLDADLSIQACTALLASGTLSNRHVVVAYVNRGLKHTAKGNHGMAIIDFDSAIEINPRFSYALFLRGRAHLEMGALEDAIADFDQTDRYLGPNPGAGFDRSSIYLNRGVAHFQNGDTDRAIVDFARLIEVEPQSHHGHHRLGIAFREIGDYDRALTHLNEAIRLDSHYPYAYFDRARLYDAVDTNPNRALVDIDQAIRLDPTFADAYVVRGLIYRALGRFSQARTDQEQAIRLDPHNVGALNLGALIHFQHKEFDLAARDLDQAVSIDPEDAETQFTTALLHLYRNNYEDGVAALARAYRLDPSLETKKGHLVRPLLALARRYDRLRRN